VIFSLRHTQSTRIGHVRNPPIEQDTGKRFAIGQTRMCAAVADEQAVEERCRHAAPVKTPPRSLTTT
jgi:hypothetical protein